MSVLRNCPFLVHPLPPKIGVKVCKRLTVPSCLEPGPPTPPQPPPSPPGGWRRRRPPQDSSGSCCRSPLPLLKARLASWPGTAPETWDPRDDPATLTIVPVPIGSISLTIGSISLTVFVGPVGSKTVFAAHSLAVSGCPPGDPTQQT